MALRTVSPSMTNRTSPPVTRAASRSGHRQPFETSTPVTRRSLQPGMHIETVERMFESADDTDIDLNSSKFVYKEHFTVKEMTSMKKEMWYDWLEYRIRMVRRRFVPSFKTVREVFIMMLLAVIFCSYIRGSYKTELIDPEAMWSTDVAVAERQKFYQSISNLRSEIENLDKKFSHQINHVESELETTVGWKHSVMEELKQIKTSQAELRDELLKLQEDIAYEKQQRTFNVISSEPEPEIAPTSSEIQISPAHLAPFRRYLPGVNVANSLIGASIDETCSSRTASAKDGLFYDVMSYVVSFQEGYVLLDRDVLSPGEAWCTYDARPTLTVKLARYIQPRAISYQHVRWNGIVPNHAPKLYDLVACRSPCCTKWEPLITDCEYKSSEDGVDEQEQFCSVPDDLHVTPVRHVQFRFRENHGNMEKTCAYLVRVYGEPVEAPETTRTQPDNGSSHLESPLLNSESE